MSLDPVQILNGLLGVGMTVGSAMLIASNRRSPWTWIRILQCLVGIFWAIIYFILVLGIATKGPHPEDFDAKWLRPTVTLTLLVLNAGIIVTLRTKRGRG